MAFHRSSSKQQMQGCGRLGSSYYSLSSFIHLFIIAIPNLYVVETVDSQKKADTLNKACAGLRPDPLRVFVQVNTSGEDGKKKEIMGK